MLRFGLIIAVHIVSIPAALADVWMVKASGSLGCKDRDTLAALSDAAALAKPPANCVRLYEGERLIEQPRPGVGFDEIMLVQRGNGSQVYVRNDAIVADPGIGSVIEDRR